MLDMCDSAQSGRESDLGALCIPAAPVDLARWCGEPEG